MLSRLGSPLTGLRARRDPLAGILRKARNGHLKEKSRQSYQMRPNCAICLSLSRSANQEKHIGKEHDAR